MTVPLDRFVASEVSNAGRSASQVAIVVDSVHEYFVRVLTLPSCKRCVPLAGRIYRDLDAFQRHPLCVPAGTVVSGPATKAATRRWYEGELVVIRTASGQRLSITGNHPILTNEGWVPANLLQVGDEVVRSLAGEGAAPLVIPDEKQRPTLVEDVRGSDGMVPLGVVPTTPQDFHGDGMYGEVDVVLADRALGNGVDLALTQLVEQEQLTRRIAKAALLASLCHGNELLLGAHASKRGEIGLTSLRFPFTRGHQASSILPGLGSPPNSHTLAYEPLSDNGAGYGVTPTEGQLAFAGAVGGDDVAIWKGAVKVPRWDAPAAPFSLESRAGYARIGKDLLVRLAPQVAGDRVIEVERSDFRGHVYNLTSAEGWFAANGLIVSNCDCQMVAVESPAAARRDGLVLDPVGAIRDGQVTGLSKADRQAILDGADVNQVINSSRGMTTGNMFGRDVKLTMEGTTRRGVYGSSKQAASRGYVVEKIGRYGYVQNAVKRTSRAPRLRPETIYAHARDRPDAVRLLRLYGYILPSI